MKTGHSILADNFEHNILLCGSMCTMEHVGKETISNEPFDVVVSKASHCLSNISLAWSKNLAVAVGIVGDVIKETMV